jgi:hypothetical protein
VAIVHAFRIKIPGLYIYFNVPSYAYQDKIISSFAFSWSVFYISAALKPSEYMLKAILISGGVAIGMLVFINLSTNFAAISESLNPRIYHLETGLLFVYWLWLIRCYHIFKNQ